MITQPSAENFPAVSPRKNDHRPAPLQRWNQWVDAFFDRAVPESRRGTAEEARLARLLVGFGYLGAVFALLFVTLYYALSHYWGSAIVVVCGSIFATVPLWLKHGLTLCAAANLYIGVMLAGFGGLCAVEGGLNGHAIAWLASIPLCALLLVDVRTAYLWCFASAAVTMIFATLELLNIPLKETFPAKWHDLISATGYVGLLVFMFLLGYIFESGRKKAAAQVLSALHQLKNANQRLVTLNEEKNEFLGIAAHDLKNPLGIVLGYADLLQAMPQPSLEEVNLFSGKIINSCTNMRELIMNLLDINAIETGMTKLDLKPCDLAKVAQEIVKENLQQAAQKEIVLSFESAESCQVQVDSRALRQILDNLISNALKFSPRHKRVFVRHFQKDHLSMVEVRDEGPGLTEEDQKRLFQKFARLSARPTGNESSTGLGLSIVKRMAEAMAGQVYCRSIPGQGATFGVSLPRL